MIEYRPYSVSWLVTCDLCGKLEHIATVKDERAALRIVRRWGWETGTSLGDLCSECARKHALGMLKPSPPEASASINVPDSELWRKVLLNEDGEQAASGCPVCEKCGKALSWMAVPRDSGMYLCDACAAQKTNG